MAGTTEPETLLANCVSVDLEGDPNTGRIRSFAALRSATTDTSKHNGGSLRKALLGLGAAG